METSNARDAIQSDRRLGVKGKGLPPIGGSNPLSPTQFLSGTSRLSPVYPQFILLYLSSNDYFAGILGVV